MIEDNLNVFLWAVAWKYLIKPLLIVGIPAFIALVIYWAVT